MVDINGDGFIDIYICRSADGDPQRRKNLLFINNGDLTFTEKAEEYGLADEGYSTQASFFDYDKDGDLDMFLINHSLQQYTTGVQENAELRKKQNPAFAQKLYRNDDKLFTDVSEKSGITSNVLSFGLGLAISDLNKDGWLDIYVSNDFNEPDYLYINNGDGTFTDKLTQSMDQVSMYSMGSDIADYNNDKLPDIMTLDMLPESNYEQKMHSGSENFNKMQFFFSKGFYYQFSRNMLHKNNGDGTFSEIGQLAGVSNTDWSWSSFFTDLDNDGNKDLFITNGYVKDYTNMDFLKYTMNESIRASKKGQNSTVASFLKKMPTISTSNYIFQNKGNGAFLNKTTEWGFGNKNVSAGAAYVDLDNDGDLDLVVNNTDDYASVYQNNSNLMNDNSYLKVKLQGDYNNERGIGAKVTLYCKKNVYFQEQIPVRGFQSAVDPVLNFGIGKNKLIDSLVVVWPNDEVQKLKDVKGDQTLVLRIQDASAEKKIDSPDLPNPYFTHSSILRFSHRENSFNDFDVQSLMPNYLSREGPSMAKGDLNGDGREDLFIGGAAGQSGKLYIQTRNDEFSEKSSQAISADSLSEDTAAEFMDVDGDGDLDLYVSSGGYEFSENDMLLQDRLYINMGSGQFVKNQEALPKMFTSTGSVSYSDFDGDGNVDLFIGGRVIPGKYPSPPQSYLYKNDGFGNFIDVTNEIAPGLQQIGMVTDAAWIDLNEDGLEDLVIVGEWMPIKVFINDNGKLEDKSDKYIKFGSSGWWNRIYTEDMDGDGDKDLIVGNLGLNSQFKASKKEPLNLYYKDFDENGFLDPILSYYINGTSYPAASLDDLLYQLPMLKKKFLSYDAYANATVQDLFEPGELESANVLKAETLSTIYLENRGTAGLALKNFPIEAQYAPIYAIASTDANGDGKKDLVMAGNNTWTRIKFGQFNANNGMLFLGNGKGNFKYVPQWKSGLNIKGNVRSLESFSTDEDQGELFIFGINNSEVTTVKLNNKVLRKKNPEFNIN